MGEPHNRAGNNWKEDDVEPTIEHRDSPSAPYEDERHVPGGQGYRGLRSFDYGRERNRDPRSVENAEREYIRQSPNRGVSFQTHGHDAFQPGSFYGVGPKGYQRSDESICEEICERMTRHGDLDARAIHIEVSGGEVTLSGSVDNRHGKHLAEALAEGVLGVGDVHNRLRIANSARKGE